MNKNLDTKVELIRNDFIKDIPDKVSKIVQLNKKIAELEYGDKDLTELRSEAHNIRGFSGNIGFMSLHVLAAQLEKAIPSTQDNKLRLNKTQVSEINTACDTLIAKMQNIYQEHDNNQRITINNNIENKESPKILIVDDDKSFCDSLSVEIEELGYNTKGITSLKDFEATLAEYKPNAIFMDIIFGEDESAGTDIVKRLKQEDKILCPIIYISARDDLQARLAAVRSGGVAFINKNFNLNELRNTLDLIIPIQGQKHYKVLIIDDDKSSGEYCKVILEHANIDALVITDPENIFEHIINYDPDVILLDMYIPKISGLEIACMIRQHQAFSFIPIVIMSGETDINKQFTMRREGADDFILKPFKPYHLVDTILNRIQRTKHTKQLIYTDGLTNLMLFSKIREQVANLLDACIRHNLNFSIALVDLDYFKSINDKYGHLIGDQALCNFADFLQSRVRKSDIVARYGGEEFVVILPYTNGKSAINALNSIREEYASKTQAVNDVEFQVTFSAGIAELRPEHQELEQLIAAADAALYEAKENGRNIIKLEHK